MVFYDVVQCFDSLWVKRTLTDLATNGVNNSLLNVINELSKGSKISVKTPVGITEEMEIEEVVMQGETLSSILCTNSMDLMSKECRLEPYKYKNKVDIPKMGFVDDILDINRCGKETVLMNNYTREEMNKRKLQLSYDKCARMHIKGRGEKEDKVKCEKIVIDKWKIEKEKKEEKIEQKDVYEGAIPIKSVDEYVYLGDTVRSDGKSKENVKQRINKGQGIVRDIIQIIEGMYLGPFFVETLKQLRTSMLISVITHNLEVSPNLTRNDIKALEDLDLSLIRKAMCLSSKSSQHILYLEFGILSVEYILKKKRIMFYQHLLQCDDPSLSKEILCEQIKNPKAGDWFKTVSKDLKDINLHLNPTEITSFSKGILKKKVEEACEKTFFNSLIRKQKSLSKGSEILYIKFETQNYLKAESKVPTELQRKILHLRIRDVYVKSNFPQAFSDKKCSASELCPSEESQKHIYSCQFLAPKNQIVHENINYELIFGSCVRTLKTITEVFFQKYEELKKITSSQANNPERPHDPRNVNISVNLGIREARRRNKHKQNKQSAKRKSVTTHAK